MYILFDLDGVLVNPYIRLYTIHTFLTKRLSLKSLNYQQYIASKQNKLPELYYLKGINEKVKKEYQRQRQELLEHKNFLHFDSVYPDVKDTLRSLQKLHRLILLTVRKNREALIWQLKSLGIFNFFEEVYSPSVKQLIKNPWETKISLIKQFLKTHKSAKINILVGDTEADIIAGKTFNITTIAVVNRLRTKEYLIAKSPRYYISNIKELVRLTIKIEKALIDKAEKDILQSTDEK